MWYITNIHNNYDKIGIHTLFWHRTPVYFMRINHLWWLITVPNKNNFHWFIPYYKHTQIHEIMDITATFWHASSPYCCWLLYQIWTAKCYFTCIRNTWYLINVQNMNKINPFFSELSQQNIRKGGHNYSNLTQSHFTSMHNTLYRISVPNMNKITTFLTVISQQTLNIYE